MKNKYYPNLASPITINGVTFKNRIFGAPMSNPELDPDCHMREEDICLPREPGKRRTRQCLHRSWNRGSCRTFSYQRGCPL